MSRLYYQEPRTRAAVTAGKSELGELMEKVVKLIPSEIITGYMLLIGLVPLIRNDSLHLPLSIVAFALCFILTPIYLLGLAEEGRPKAAHLIVSTIAFGVWAYVVSGQLILPEQYYDPTIAPIILVVFTLISGAVPLGGQ